MPWLCILYRLNWICTVYKSLSLYIVMLPVYFYSAHYALPFELPLPPSFPFRSYILCVLCVSVYVCSSFFYCLCFSCSIYSRHAIQFLLIFMSGVEFFSTLPLSHTLSVCVCLCMCCVYRCVAPQWIFHFQGNITWKIAFKWAKKNDMKMKKLCNAQQQQQQRRQKQRWRWQLEKKEWAAENRRKKPQREWEWH